METKSPENYADDFLQQILEFPPYTGPLSLIENDEDAVVRRMSSTTREDGFHGAVLQMQSNSVVEESMRSMFSAFDHVQPHSAQPIVSPFHQAFDCQPTPAIVVTTPDISSICPKARAPWGQATDPHSVAERLRRERIAKRLKSLQEVVRSSNKKNRAAMLDGIIDYVKFLRLQVKVLSTSRLGDAGAAAELVADKPLLSSEGETEGVGNNSEAWDKWSNDGTEEEVAKLMKEDVGAAMQLLQSKALCLMPVTLAATIYPMDKPDGPIPAKPKLNASS
ncbi:Myc-type, basic helix-loop-helix (bHLH) domain [Dillenia turbinata]|uniref:Myc-type, basic helix-loop-helix (BHLH) domain n=1 Tax=Dillenia turbinata TaxID=194707 RepID=A0AAN8UBV0_9MAGN